MPASSLTLKDNRTTEDEDEDVDDVKLSDDDLLSGLCSSDLVDSSDSKEVDKTLTEKEQWHMQSLCDASNPLHAHSALDAMLSELLSLYLDGLLYHAVDLVKKLKTEIGDMEDSSDLLAALETHPLIADIRAKHKETLEMLDFMESAGGWSLLSEDKVWKSECMSPEGMDTHSFRVTGVGDVPLFNICALFNEVDLIKTWMPLCVESLDFGLLSRYCKTGYVRIGLFWPVSDREVMLYGYTVDDLDNGKLLVFFDSRGSDYDSDFKGKSSGIRVDVHIGGFMLEVLSEERTKITCVFNCDPKVAVPYAVLNWFCGKFVAVFLKMMVACAKFEEGSPYLKRIEDNQLVYGRVKDMLSKGKIATAAADT